MTESVEPSGYSDDSRTPKLVREDFPALKRIREVRRRGRVPYVQQTQSADCGAACLCMVLGYHGRYVALDDVRAEMAIGRDGVSAYQILKVGEKHNLRGRGLRIELEDLKYLPTGSVLHWELNHFVVFQGWTRRGVRIVDPARGRRLVSHKKVSASFTGAVLTFEPTENLHRTAAGKKSVWPYFRYVLKRRSLLTQVLIASLMLQLFALALPVLTGLVVDWVIPQADLRLLEIVGLVMVGGLVFHTTTYMVRGYVLLQLRTAIDAQLTLGFLDHLVSLPYSFFQRRSTGDLMMRVNSNTAIRQLLTSATLSGVLDGLFVLSYLALLFAFSVQIAIIACGIATAQVGIFLLARRRTRELMAEVLEARANSSSYLVELISAIETLKLAGAEKRAVDTWANLWVDELNVGLEQARLDLRVATATGALKMGAPMLILAVGATLVLQGDLTLGSMLALNALAIGLLAPVGTLVNSLVQLQTLSSYLERIEDVLSMPPEQSTKSGLREAPAKLNGSLELDRLTFRYSGNAPRVLNEVSGTIPAGKMVAIVGESGSGKSTLAKLLACLYSPESGRVRVDGDDIQELEASSLRSRLGVVPQHPYMFAGTVRQNIALRDPNAPRDRVMMAARLACVHDDILAMPMAYETFVSDAGSSLSGGQRQRIAIARAILDDPRVMILDEATSALDTTTEKRVLANLARLRCTRVVITHRLTTIRDADEIWVVVDGRIAERGTHLELAAANGPYATLLASMHRSSAPHLSPDDVS